MRCQPNILRQSAVLLASCVLLLLCGVAQAASLLSAASDGSLWSITRKELMTGVYREYHKVDKTTYRFDKRKITCVNGAATGDVTVRWDEKGEHVVGVNTTFYNKGDDGSLDKEGFENLLKAAKEALTCEMSVEPKVRKVGAKDAGVKPRAWVWSNENCAVMLEAFSSGSGKRYMAEFIRLSIAPTLDDLERGGASDTARKSELKEHVRTDDDGSVWIGDIPMVDQGEKGYCVPASLSRVFAYYGVDGVDQHALAALCKSSGDGGTTLEDMSKAIKTISNSFHMSIKQWNWVDLKKIEKDYIKIANREKVYSDMLNPSILLKVIKSKTAITKKAMKDVRGFVDAGVPIVWAVMLGLYPEEGLPQAGGGHMRLIIGYNEKTRQIIYSDSWGARHEKKSMPLDQACAITQALFVLRPQR